MATTVLNKCWTKAILALVLAVALTVAIPVFAFAEEANDDGETGFSLDVTTTGGAIGLVGVGGAGALVGVHNRHQRHKRMTQNGQLPGDN